MAGGSPRSGSASAGSGFSSCTRLLKSSNWESNRSFAGAPTRRDRPQSTPTLARKSATLFPSLLTWVKDIALLPLIYRSICNSLWAILQLLQTLEEGEPWRIFVAIWMRIWESPSMMSGKRFLSCAIRSPCQRPSNSAELLVSQPWYPRKIMIMFPLWSLMIPPNPEFPRLPLDAPSKLNLYISFGGEDHFPGGEPLEGLVPLIIWSCFLWNSQLFQIDCSWGRVGRSSWYHVFREMVSSMLFFMVNHNSSRDLNWFLNILPFLSFQMVQVTKPGMSFHM